MKNMDQTDYYRALGHRLRVTRLVLGITEEEAAAASSVSVKTYRKYEAGSKHKGGKPVFGFAGKYDVDLNWLIAGDTQKIKSHLHRNAKGNVVILPVLSHERLLRNQSNEFRQTMTKAEHAMKKVDQRLDDLGAAQLHEQEMVLPRVSQAAAAVEGDKR